MNFCTIFGVGLFHWWLESVKHFLLHYMANEIILQRGPAPKLVFDYPVDWTFQQAAIKRVHQHWGEPHEPHQEGDVEQGPRGASSAKVPHGGRGAAA